MRNGRRDLWATSEGTRQTHRASQCYKPRDGCLWAVNSPVVHYGRIEGTKDAPRPGSQRWIPFALKLHDHELLVVVFLSLSLSLYFSALVSTTLAGFLHSRGHAWRYSHPWDTSQLFDRRRRSRCSWSTLGKNVKKHSVCSTRPEKVTDRWSFQSFLWSPYIRTIYIKFTSGNDFRAVQDTESSMRSAVGLVNLLAHSAMFLLSR